MKPTPTEATSTLVSNVLPAELRKLHKYAAEGTEKKTPKGEEKRGEVLKLAHESIMGGHMGTAKVRDRLVKEIYCLGVQGDVKRFCLSCDKYH
ncbi:hypothetical protein CHS0354_005129 [Potamilus streckersoni]|uniref:Integrase zinc-binding domain-containing protein n=1 Tax=Potamilus streckersoni TaxID=2493646 RepID=A0AAE0VV80_9BIVA|nr:hypothetical protein CHS0354_005129 [Potamilus streckersoni]